MKSRKILVLLFIVQLVFCLSLVSAADNTVSSYDVAYTMEASASVVEAGDTFTITVAVPQNTGFKSATANITYDSEDVVEYVESSSADTVFAEPYPTVKHTSDATGEKVAITVGNGFNAIFDPTNAPVYSETGTVAVLTFKINDTFEGTATINFTLTLSVLDENGKTTTNVCGDSLTISAYNPASHEHTFVVDERVEPTCTETGLTQGSHCSECGFVEVAQEIIPANGHTESDVVVENNVDPTCTANGSYDNVVYCTVCEAELIRETITVDALGHTAGEVVVENEKAPTCTTEGSYDNVVYCTVCEAELSRETITVDALGHTNGDAVKENEKAPTCTAKGSYELATYCTVCGAETGRETIIVDMIPHTPGEAVKENNVDPTCTATGSYDLATYCTACQTELGREKVTVEMLPHTPGEAVKENNVDPTCTTDGSYDMATYCTVCNTETSREHTVVDKLGHTYGEWIDDGDTQHKRVCACGEVESADHEYGDWEVVQEATEETEGKKAKTCVCGHKVEEKIPTLEPEGMRPGVVVAIVVLSVLVLGAGGFALYWFVFRKRSV